MAFLKFTLLRLALVVAFFVACMYLGLGAILSAIVAAILAWCVTYLFFRSLRDEAGATLQRRFREGAPPRRNALEHDDAAAEDALDPRTSGDGARKDG